MRKTNFDFVKKFKLFAIISVAVMLVGLVVALIFGVNLDINFKGGSRFTYTYTGEISLDDAKTTIEAALGKSVTVTESTDITGGSAKLVVSLTADESLSTELQQKVTKSLQEKYPNQAVTLGDSNSVNPTIAGSFFAKSLFATAIAGVLVVVYIGLRFRKIGGVSAGITALVALLHDIAITLVFTIIFRLEIDSNFIAVVLTIFGYSLNDTIVVYDRIRENQRLYPDLSKAELVNQSVNQTMGRTITTSVVTIVAVLAVAVVAELFGLTSLRTFAIPMAVGIISGCYSSVLLASPLWVHWHAYSAKHFAKKKGKK